MYYIHFDENGKIIGRYIEGIHSNIPAEAKEVSDETWGLSINPPTNKVMKWINNRPELMDDQR